MCLNLLFLMCVFVLTMCLGKSDESRSHGLTGANFLAREFERESNFEIVHHSPSEMEHELVPSSRAIFLEPNFFPLS